ncbi:SH3 domain-containing protein, partial [Candidatus Curtissbacteria bacterium]|nr:SH3 domain-containing protein [Candidatus Curtissbacteria bacterium]
EASHSEKVTLTQGTLAVVNWELANSFLAQSGEVLALEKGQKGLFITSMPDEAAISLDGRLVGKTPQKIEEVEEGDHKVSLSKPGYVEREFVVKTSNKYLLVADVTLASGIATGEVAVPSPLPEPQKVEVGRTPQGFLRVRKEPSTSAPEIGRVKDGDELEIVQETQGWIQIKFEGKQGWVSSQYVKKLP